MLSRRSLLVLSAASLVAGCSRPDQPRVAFRADADAHPQVLRAFEDFSRQYGYTVRGSLDVADVLGPNEIGEEMADYRAWRSLFYFGRYTDESGFVATFYGSGLLALGYEELFSIADELKNALRNIDGVLIDENY